MYADELDRAADLQQAANDAALQRVQRAARPEQVQNPDGTWPHTECVDCGEDIELPRLEMGRVRCFACQELLERTQKMRRR
jgi:RNA polymerase-binding transcription factor DksA